MRTLWLSDKLRVDAQVSKLVAPGKVFVCRLIDGVFLPGGKLHLVVTAARRLTDEEIVAAVAGWFKREQLQQPAKLLGELIEPQTLMGLPLTSGYVHDVSETVDWAARCDEVFGRTSPVIEEFKRADIL